MSRSSSSFLFNRNSCSSIPLAFPDFSFDICSFKCSLCASSFCRFWSLFLLSSSTARIRGSLCPTVEPRVLFVLLIRVVLVQLLHLPREPLLLLNLEVEEFFGFFLLLLALALALVLPLLFRVIPLLLESVKRGLVRLQRVAPPLQLVLDAINHSLSLSRLLVTHVLLRNMRMDCSVP